MNEKLKALYSTLCLISTKGNDTLLMADCLKHLHQCIQETEVDTQKPSND